MTTIAVRTIGIDMGHRVTNHATKCRNVHGHRYTIEVALAGDLAAAGEQEGMVLDFGFLKDLMMAHIDAPCDHGLCLWLQDPLLEHILPESMRELADRMVNREGWAITAWQGGKLYIIDVVPTAENLARHWFDRLVEPVGEACGGRARLRSVRVWETPNCWAEYKPIF